MQHYAAAGAAVRGGKVTPVGATGSKVRFARHPGAIVERHPLLALIEITAKKTVASPSFGDEKRIQDFRLQDWINAII